MAAASSSAVSQAELTFEYFPKLPPELRRMIWKEALPGPRLVSLERLFISVPSLVAFSLMWMWMTKRIRCSSVKIGVTNCVQNAM